MKFKNLEAEMVRKDVSRAELAKELNISYRSLGLKINAVRNFKDDEMFAIKRILKTDLSLDDLFQKEE